VEEIKKKHFEELCDLIKNHRLEFIICKVKFLLANGEKFGFESHDFKLFERMLVVYTSLRNIRAKIKQFSTL
jgi:hypothetical protein